MTSERRPSLEPGDEVEATKLLSWTVEQFDDYPLIVEPGDRGVIDEIVDEEEYVYVTWENDKFSHMRKSMSFREALALKKIEKANEQQV